MKAPKRSGVAYLVAALFFTTACGQKLPEIKFEKFELANGLDVILHEDHSIPVVSVNIWYNVGSKNEKPGRTGFAHLFEHMMFQGSQHHNSLYSEPLESVGGDANGSTTEDFTNYLENIPSRYLERALWLEADRMGYLVPAMSQERLDNQRDVVKNERRERVDNQPYGKLRGIMKALMYPENHPYGWEVIGSMADLSAASLNDVIEFFQTYYTPNNASLCIAGDFDPAEAKALVEKYFGSIPPGPPVEQLQEWVPVLEGVRRAIGQDDVNLPQLTMAWHTPPLFKPGDAEMDLLASVLGSGKNSRLYKSLVYEKQLAQNLAVYQESHMIGSIFVITATAQQGHTLQEIEDAIDEELSKLLLTGITEQEFKLAQTQYEAYYIRSLERLGGFYGRADLLNAFNIRLGDPGRFQWDLDRYLNATPANVMDAAKKYLDPDKRGIVFIVPQGEFAADSTEFDRNQEPGPGSRRGFTPPVAQKTVLSNGLELYVVENHKLPLIQANLVIKSGYASDPVNLPGLASLTADLLDEGTKSRTALQISDEARTLGTGLSTSSAFDMSTIAVNSITRNFDQSLNLMADVALNPSFPEGDLERLRKTYLSRISLLAKDPNAQAFKVFYRQLYGEGHPYAQPYTGTGTEASMNAIKRDDVTSFYRTHFMPNNAVMVVVGDITLDDAKSRLERVFKNWKAGDLEKNEIPAPTAPQGTSIYIVDNPGAAQSMIVAGHLGLKRNSPDYIPAALVNFSLGGESIARLYMNLRQDKGYTYGAYSTLTWRVGQGAFFAYAPVQTQVTKDAVSEMLKEIKGMGGDRPLAEEELTSAKLYLTEQLAQSFGSIANIAGQIASQVVYGLPLDYWGKFPESADAVDLSTAHAMAKKLIHPDDLVVVVYGDRAKIEAGLRELNVGEIIPFETAGI